MSIAQIRVRFIDVAEVTAVTMLSRSQVYRLMAAGKFPQQVKLSAQRSVWAEHEVQAWMQERLAARQQPQQQQTA
jgi:prophage regulatory protein